VALIGYARVSTDRQTLDAQHAALKSAGADKVFAEKVSGAKTNRRQLERAIEALGGRGRVARDPAGPARAEHAGLAQRACHHIGQGCGLPLIGRYLGRYHDRPWAAYADRTS
jgi:hypothetical protein